DLHYKNSFDSSPYAKKRLEVSHFTGMFSSSRKLWTGVLAYLVKSDIRFDRVALRVYYLRTERDARRLEIAYYSFPDAFGFASRDTRWVDSEWHKSRIAIDPKRQDYVTKFVAWGEAYVKQLDQGFENKGFETAAAVPSFAP